MRLSYMNGIAPLLVVGAVAVVGAIVAAFFIIPDKMAEVLANVGRMVSYFLLSLLYKLWSALAGLVDILQELFLQLAGMRTVTSGVNVADGDAVTSAITGLWPIFTALAGVAFFLLVVFTIFAIIRQHYREKDGGNPYVVVFRMFKGMLMFSFITVACLLGVYAARFILRGISGALTGEGEYPSLSKDIFLAMSYEGNRARASYSPTSAMDRLEFDYSHDAFILINGVGIDSLFSDETRQWEENPETGEMEPVPYDNREEIEGLGKIGFDAALAGFDAQPIIEGSSEIIDRLIISAKGDPASMVAATATDEAHYIDYLYKDWDMIERFFIPTKFNWIIGFGGIFICVSVMLNFTAALVARIVELATLYLFSPLTLAFFPFDDGQQFNSAFVKPFYKKTISVFAPVLALSAFFIIFKNIDILEFNVFPQAGLVKTPINQVVDTLITLILFTMMPKMRAIIQQIFGAENMEEKGLGASLKDGWNKISGKDLRKGAKTAVGGISKGITYVNKKISDYKANQEIHGYKHKKLADTRIGRLIGSWRDEKRQKFKDKYAKEVTDLGKEEAIKRGYVEGSADWKANVQKLGEAKAKELGIQEKKLLGDRIVDSRPWKAAAKVNKGIGDAATTVKKGVSGIKEKFDKSKVGQLFDVFNPVKGAKTFANNSALFQTAFGKLGWFEKSTLGKALFEGSFYSRYKAKLDLEKAIVARDAIDAQEQTKFSKPVTGGVKKLEDKERYNKVIELINGKDGNGGLKAEINAAGTAEKYWEIQKAGGDARALERRKLYEYADKDGKQPNGIIHDAVEELVETQCKGLSAETKETKRQEIYNKVANNSPDDILEMFKNDTPKIQKAIDTINEQREPELKDIAARDVKFREIEAVMIDGKGSFADLDSVVDNALKRLRQVDTDLNDYCGLLRCNQDGLRSIVDAYKKFVGEGSDAMAVQQAFMRKDKTVMVERAVMKNGVMTTEKVDVTPDGYKPGDSRWLSHYMREQNAAFDKEFSKYASKKDVAQLDIASKIADRISVQHAINTAEEQLKAHQDTVRNMSTDGQQIFSSKFMAKCLEDGKLVEFGDELIKAAQGLPSKLEYAISSQIKDKSELEKIGKMFTQYMGDPNGEMRGFGDEKAANVMAKMFRISFIDRVNDALGATAGLIDQQQIAIQNLERDTLREFQGYLQSGDKMFAPFLKDLEYLIKNNAMMGTQNPAAMQEAFRNAYQNLERFLDGKDDSTKLLYEDFRKKLAALPNWEVQNKADKAEGDGIRAMMQKMLNLAGDSQLRSLNVRGAGKPGDTS